MQNFIQSHRWKIQFYLAITSLCFVSLISSSCKQSNKDELLSDADNAATTARYALTNGVDLETNSQRLFLADDVAKAVRMGLTNQVNLETLAAVSALKQLHEMGRLPNISKDEHGQVTSDLATLVDSNKVIEIVYPVSRTFHFLKDGESSTNNYILVKQAKDSEWKLQNAWLTDSNGQIIKEWPVQ